MLQSIQAKMIGILAAFFIVQGVVLAVISDKQDAIAGRYSSLIDNELGNKALVDELNLSFKIQVQEWKNVLIRGHNSADLDKYWGKFEDRHQKVQDIAGQLLGNSVIAANTRSNVQQFKDVHSKLLSQYKEGKNAFLRTYDHRDGDRAVRGIDREPSQLLVALSKEIADTAQVSSDELAASASRLHIWINVVIVAMSLVACAALLLLMRLVFVRPIVSLEKHVASMAKGDFSQTIVPTSQDEIGQLAQSLNTMRAELCAMLSNMAHAADQLLGSAGKLSSAAQGIDDDTHNAQDHAGQIAAAMTQMSASIAEVASNASIAADATDQANHGAGEGMRVMEEAIVAISAVAEEVSRISKDMTTLEQHTTSVGAVLDVIKGIAEQTNLLALNAAIEAARAGEQGRGFAVVADEVRALAQRTQESTEEIHHIIEAVQNGAKTAASGMDAGNEKTEHAVSLARRAGDAIRKIVSEIDRVQGMSAQIATAAEEQSAATEEINRNVVNMTSLSEKAHESAAHTHTISSSLNGVAQELHQSSSRFKLPG